MSSKSARRETCPAPGRVWDGCGPLVLSCSWVFLVSFKVSCILYLCIVSIVSLQRGELVAIAVAVAFAFRRRPRPRERRGWWRIGIRGYAVRAQRQYGISICPGQRIASRGAALEALPWALQWYCMVGAVRSRTMRTLVRLYSQDGTVLREMYLWTFGRAVFAWYLVVQGLLWLVDREGRLARGLDLVHVRGQARSCTVLYCT